MARHARFAEDAVSLIQGYVQSQENLLCEVEVAPVAAVKARASMESKVLSLTASVPILQREVGQLAGV